MEMSNQYDELFIRYLLNDLNTEEETFVLHWINSNEQNRQYFEELKKTWNLTAVKELADVVDVNEEWGRFTQMLTLKEKQYNSPGEVIEFEKPTLRRNFYKLLIATGVAASILLVIGIGSGLFDTKNLPEQTVAKSNNEKSNSASVAFRHQLNTSGKIEKIKLRDGSEVLLFNESEISYNEPFTDNKRDIILKGKAEFKVAKDKSKPFTVYSGDISTTALGTRFVVTAYEKAANIIVRLYEGKVLVKTNYITKNAFQKDFYLLPGDEFIYDKNQLTARLRTLKGNKDNNVFVMPTIDNPSFPKNDKGTWYMFNNQSLSQVFDQLENMYSVKITYSKKDVYNKYFIGKFNKLDSVEHILREIAALNHLKLTVNNDRFIIAK